MEHGCVACDSAKAMTPFSNETMTISYGNRSKEVSGLSGWRCMDCGEIEFDAQSARCYAATGDELLKRVAE